MEAITFYGRRRDALTAVFLFLLSALIGYGESRLALREAGGGMAGLIISFIAIPSLFLALLIFPWALFPKRAYLEIRGEGVRWRGYPGMRESSVPYSEMSDVKITEDGFVSLGLDKGYESVISYSYGQSPTTIFSLIEERLSSFNSTNNEHEGHSPGSPPLL
jgi:hypothetical protein